MITRDIYINSKQVTPPIRIVYGTNNLPVQFCMKDVELASGNTAKFYSLAPSENRYEQTGTIDTSAGTITFTPVAGFFETGQNLLQCEITQGGKFLYSFAVDVLCAQNLLEDGTAAEAEAIKTYVERAEDAADSAEASAQAAQDVLDSIPADYSELSDTVDGLVDTTEDLSEKVLKAFPTGSASGAVASFPDGADNIPMKSVIAHIEPVQSGSGDPSPDNVRPISGFTGATVVCTNKNLCKVMSDTSFSDGLTVTVQEDGGLKIVGTSASMHAMDLIRPFETYGKNIKPGKYRLLVTGSGTGFDGVEAVASSVGIQVYKDNVSVIITRDNDVTIPEDYEWCYAKLRIGINTFDCIVYPMIYRIDDEEKLDDTWQVPETATYPITFDSAGTVYGGYVDLVSGVLTVTHKSVDLSSLTWVVTGEYYRARTPSGCMREIGGVDILSSHFVKYPNVGKPCIRVNDRNYSATDWTVVYNSGAESLEDFQTLISGATLVYPLEMPLIYQLSKNAITSLLGQNNVWCDAGDIEVDYRADPAMYIDRNVTPIKGFVATEESGTTASNAYTAGQYFILDGAFCKALVNIASGATFTLGTNYSVTTIGAELYSALHS